ncbi:AGE family epimerase/isomerase [Caulobacter henricii]|uniref:Mannose-6-phosphate isomerase n=1 Tax=Caulobacter henricii TaxID=69395 RepID=A0A0P0P3G6_9CAUL|nr:AGE family epimerase/isomerase [Caulobacter henricii]ALL14987.1 mannose-6-phosphate isomerase [Caulobacter henricii]
MTDAFSDAARLRDRLKTWVNQTAFPLWWSVGADQTGGGFFETVQQSGEAIDSPRRGRVLPRQIYAFAAAGDLGWSGPWRSAVDHGLGYYLDVYRRPDGLFRTLVGPGGVSLDETAALYDQAFALFALASACQVTGRADLREVAVSVRQTLIDTLKHELGGFRESTPMDPPQHSNPHMHLFEACLAWAAFDPDPVWRSLADEIAELALARFIDPGTGALREFFAADWTPAPGQTGQIWEPGHQYEWGWLLLRWGRLAARPDATAAALRMIDLAETVGVDAERGVAINALLTDMSVHDGGARLWPQTERIKAGVLAAEITGEARWWGVAADGAEGLLQYLRTPVPGLWRDKLRPDGTFVEEAAPASSFYHIVCAIAEMDRAVKAAT